jgi:hypothetical protein
LLIKDLFHFNNELKNCILCDTFLYVKQEKINHYTRYLIDCPKCENVAVLFIYPNDFAITTENMNFVVYKNSKIAFHQNNEWSFHNIDISKDIQEAYKKFKYLTLFK